MTEGSLTKQQITALPRIFHPRYHIGISQYSLIGNCGLSSSFLASCGGTTAVMVLVVMAPWATSGHCHQKTDEWCQPNTTKGICRDPASSKGALWYLLGGVLWVSLVLKTLRVPSFDPALDKEWSLAGELMSVHDQIMNIWDFSNALLSGSPCAFQTHERTDGKTEARRAAVQHSTYGDRSREQSPPETHLRGCAQPLLCSNLTFGRQLSCGLRNIRSIPDLIHSQKSLRIPKHNYFPQLTDILNKSTDYFGCHGWDGGLRSLRHCASTAREEKHHEDGSSRTTTYTPKASSDQGISTGARPRALTAQAAKENHRKDSYHSSGCVWSISFGTLWSSHNLFLYD